jgi:stage V sporulation protein R
MLAAERADLDTTLERIWELGQRFGLDPFPTHFDLVPATIMYEFGAYGLPGRFSHWTRGKAFHFMKTQYDYGLSKIYELVINTNPAQAFLMEANSVLENKFVAAHVLAHVDFFKHNVYFGETCRQMVDQAGLGAARIRDYEGRFGPERVEAILDAALSLEEHGDATPVVRIEGRQTRRTAAGQASAYDDLWYVVDGKPKEKEERRKFPEEPQKDLLAFLQAHSPELEDWERDIVGIVRQEMAYFMPQARTKIINEGWASYWHERIMSELDFTPQEHREFRALHSAVISPPASKSHLNPYYVGYHVLHDIEDRWNARALGSSTMGLDHEMNGREKLFEVRETESDVSFLRKYLTKALVESLDLFVYKLEGDQWVVTDKDWERVRDALVATLTHHGVPYIELLDADYRRSGELYLRHRHEGEDLDVGYAEKTLGYVHRLWGRPVHVETVVDGTGTVLSFDGVTATSRVT